VSFAGVEKEKITKPLPDTVRTIRSNLLAVEKNGLPRPATGAPQFAAVSSI